MASNNFYIANLAFMLDYTDGTTNDEIEMEIFKIAFQDQETVHYDRSVGGNFKDLEQEPKNVATAYKFSTNFIESIYYVNEEKGFDPYIVVGFSDITINDDVKNNKYLVNVQYRLLKNITKEGMVNL
jgi:hypothetical protein